MDTRLSQTTGNINLRHYRTRDCRQDFHVGNAAQHCPLGLFQDSDFAGDLEDSKLCLFGCRTFAPICCMRKNQTSVSHSSTESEIMSPDALRRDGLLALDLWNMVIEVLHSPNNTTTTTNPASVKRCEARDSSRNHTKLNRRETERLINCHSYEHTFISRRVPIIHL